MMMKKQFKKVYIEISNVCNLKCPFCAPTSRSNEVMTAEKFAHIVKEVKNYSDYIYLHVKGEPLIHPQFSEILNIAQENGIKVNITTNGVALEKAADILFASTATHQINISLHSIVCLNDKDKEKYLSSIYNFIAKASQIKSFFVSLRLWIKNDELNTYVLNYLGQKLNKEITISRKSIIDNVYISADEEFAWPNLSAPLISSQGYCWGTRDQIAILVNGDVVPCCLDADGIITLGNIYTESLTSILNKPKFLAIKAGFENGKVVEELCQKCSYRLRFQKK